MDNDYIDLESEIWTKRLKKIAIIKFVMKCGVLGFYALFVCSIVSVLQLMTPYVNDKNMILETAFTNSQITAMLVVVFLGVGTVIISRIVTRFLRI